MGKLFTILLNLHDFRSAFRVRLRSRGVARGVDVAVFTNDSNISSSPSVKMSSVILSAGDLGISGRRRLNAAALSILSTNEFCVPNNCLRKSNET